MNASGRPNTCKSNEAAMLSGARVRNAYATYLHQGDNISKEVLTPHKTTLWHQRGVKFEEDEDGHASD